MNARTREKESLADLLIRRAARIYRSLQAHHAIQVRWHDGQLLTFRYPAPRGYGVRGELVAVYTSSAAQDWIEDDLIAFMQSVGDTCAPVSA